MLWHDGGPRDHRAGPVISNGADQANQN